MNGERAYPPRLPHHVAGTVRFPRARRPSSPSRQSAPHTSRSACSHIARASAVSRGHSSHAPPADLRRRTSHTYHFATAPTVAWQAEQTCEHNGGNEATRRDEDLTGRERKPQWWGGVALRMGDARTQRAGPMCAACPGVKRSPALAGEVAGAVRCRSRAVPAPRHGGCRTALKGAHSGWAARLHKPGD